jgi:uncharacterized delta-60 repeat protein
MEMCNLSPRAPARRSVSAGFALALAFGFGGAATAADGDFDLTFGDGGYTFMGETGATFSLPVKPVVQPDGKILICSGLTTGSASGDDMLVARFTPDGEPDSSFSFDGKVTIDFGGQNETCNALVVQPDGKIVVVGTTSSGPATGDFAIARLDADGSLDDTFGAGSGEATVAFDIGGSNYDNAGAVALQPDGKIVVAGWANGDNGDDFAVVRLLPDGTRDSTFNVTGRVTVGFDFPTATNKTDEGDSVSIDAEGRILVSGIAETSAGNIDVALIRLDSSGHLDHEFDADGRVTVAFDAGGANGDISYQSIIQRDGRIVVVGDADAGSGSTTNIDLSAARLLPDGSLDASFGNGGKVLVPFDLVANGGEVATGVVEDSLGRLVIAGAANFDAQSNLHGIATRLRADGSLDTSFGVFGKKVFDFGGVFELLGGVALQGTQIIIAGQSGDQSTSNDNFVARLEVDLIFGDGFD